MNYIHLYSYTYNKEYIRRQKMNSKDIDRLVRWAVDSDIKTFAEDAYGITGTAFDEMRDEYLVDKFITMQLNFIRWVASLSENNRDRLANNITKGE
jgi:hypothetical protein